jgi:exoribonuclease R
MAKLTLNLNRRSKSAQMAGRDSVAPYTRLYFRDNPQERVEARVLAISPTKINVIAPRFGIEGPLDILTADDETDNAAVYDETKYELRFKDLVLRVFGLVYISILVEKPKSAADDVG